MTERRTHAWSLRPGITLLEASAGTGKTRRITDHFLWLVVEHAVEVRKVLVVTFTEAATAELRDRIRSRLRRALEALRGTAAAPDADDTAAQIAALAERVGAPMAARRLETALRDFDQAEVSTIHGFCKRSLQRHAFESGVEFDAELVTDLGPVVEEVVLDFWVRRLHDASEAVLRVLDLHGVTPGSLLSLAKVVVESPDMPVDMAPAVPSPPLDVVFAAWRDAWRSAGDAWARGRDEALRIVRQAVEEGRIPRVVGASIPDADGFACWVDEVHRFFTEEQEPGTALPARLTPVFTCDVKKAFQARQERHPVLDAFRRFVEADRALAPALFNEARQIGLDLVEAVRRDVPARKRALNVQTFSDLLYQLRDALLSPDRGPALRAALLERYDAAMIDEFQDTDPVQWGIFRETFGGADRFLCLIGDPKQAIYSFRGADIHAYLAAKDLASHTERLSTNYRSDEGLVGAVNHLFDPDRLPDAFMMGGAIEYRRIAAHHRGSRLDLGVGGGGGGGMKPPFELRFCRRDEAQLATNRGKGLGIAAPWARVRIAGLVAADIAALLAARPRLRGAEQERPLGPGDVAVLTRTNAEARTVQEALRRAGIHSVVHGTASVFSTAEARELAFVLAAVLEPTSTSAVKTALSTELVGLRASELVGLEEDDAAWDGWSRRLRGWQARWSDDGFMSMFRDLLAHLDLGDGDLSQRVLGWRDGERRMTDLLHLAELIHAEAAASRLGPRGTMSWLLRQIEEPDDSGDSAALRLESDDDAVDIITIHRAKGLERLVVFCPYLWGSSKLADTSALRYHRDGERRLDPSPRIDGDFPEEKRKRIAAVKDEAEAERMRLLYVAVTRAKHRCVVYWGWFNGAGGSALAYLLHGEDRSRFKEMSDEELLLPLRRIAAGSGGTIDVTEHALARDPEPVRRPAGAVDENALGAREWRRPRPLDTSWRRGSFTGLTRDRAPDPEAGKESDEVDGGEALDVEGPPAVDRGIVLTQEALPGGRQTGIFLHALYEHIDFDCSAERLRAALAVELDRFGLDAAALADPLLRATAAALRAPLSAGGTRFRLADLSSADRLSELGFDFPVAGGLEPGGWLTSAGLASLFDAHRTEVVPAGYAERVAGLQFEPLRGFMRGAIDLVFRRDGRWYLADYKSNHLGDRLADYAPDLLPAAMSEGHYFLQYHLYALALHRWLRWRVPGYRYDDGFGGVFYLFLRGMAPSGAEPAGAPHGVFFDRPRPEMIDALDALMQAGDGGRP
jgi:exodeoxyribonuclease V beta subunit